ncbi:T9SS type A sorting domain-containing protein, partial [Winogradskyella poriferorum]|uniref:T9SS type A sorting domain-containing protein n=1 Tax=Winogradskyella poriferorum TaxID=307627 RepID=UPI003D64E0E0
ATNDILGTPASGPFNLEGAPAGTCDIWYLRYTGDIGLGTVTNVADLSGCFDLSNPISVTRLTGIDCDALSVDDVNFAFDFNLYPNPARDVINLEFNTNNAVDLQIRVFDMLGKQVLQSTSVQQDRMTLDISDLSLGTYFINVTNLKTGFETVKRILKN